MTTTTHPSDADVAAAREVLRFLTRWAPFGGGDEEILPTFGITPTTFYSRARVFLGQFPYLIPGHDTEALAAYCTRKLRTGGPPPHGTRE